MVTAIQSLKSVSEDPRLSRIEAAAYLGVSVAFLGADVCTGRHKVPYLKIGRRCVYLKSGLDRWLGGHEVNAPSAEAV